MSTVLNTNTRWRFRIVDRHNHVTYFNEPVGWDKESVEIKRDLDWHGIFFNHQGNNYQFHGTVGKMLYEEYQLWGAQGIMYIGIEERCDEAWEEAEYGKFVFSAFDYVCGDECYAVCPIEDLGEVMDLRNRLNQKVNLDALESFDETTDLTPYDFLPIEMLLPSKGVLLQDLANNDEVKPQDIFAVPENEADGGSPNSEYGMLNYGVNTIEASEIGGFFFETSPFYTTCKISAGSFAFQSQNAFDISALVFPAVSFIAPLDISPIVNYTEGTTNYGVGIDLCSIDFNVGFTMTNPNFDAMSVGSIFMMLLPGKVGTVLADYVVIAQANSLSIAYSNPAFDLPKGSKLFIFSWLYLHKTHAQQINGLPAFTANTILGNYFKLKKVTHTEPTFAKLYLINETISRIAESITNNKLRCYSEYFGRTDSQPYSVAEDGCGSLEAVTNGLRIRQAEERITDKPSVFSLSLEDVFNVINPIHNIGMGIEKDTRRAGFNCLRVENWKHFYNDDVVMTCIGVNKITTKCYDRNIYSTFKFGYDRWEAEEYNGLDEFLTQRFYRTTLSEVKNDLVQVSKGISSGYAWEITRRIGNKNSKDWRYDNDTFIICLQRGKYTINVTIGGGGGFVIISPALDGAGGGDEITISGTGPDGIDGTYTLGLPISTDVTTANIGPFAPNIGVFYGDIALNGSPLPSNQLSVELGNIDSPENIIDPSTIYNWRISPFRNALRWMNRVLMSYRQFTSDSKIVFMDGQANYHATGKMLSEMCRLENASYEENATINKDVFEDEANAKPLNFAERVEFEYPMSTKEYKAIKANPYGKIAYSGCIEGEGYIDTIKYDREEGKATFLLIPKIPEL